MDRWIQEHFAQALSANSPGAFGLVFLAGVLASLLPCVYPVIPLTVAYLGATTAKTKLRAFLVSLMYVLGMCATYTILGAIAIVLKVTFGAWARHPLLHIAMGAFYLLVALWMLDVLHLSFGSGKSAARDRPTDFLGAFLVGMSAGVVLGPCTGPVLLVVLRFAAGSERIIRALLLMMTYSLGMGVLFLLIGTFSALAARRPKPGKWMVVLKNVFAVVIIVMACAFLVNAGVLWERMARKPAAGTAPGGGVEGPASAPWGENITLSVDVPAAPAGIGTPLPRMTVPVLVPSVRGWTTRAFRTERIETPVVLVFWATWCAGCKEEIPVISRVAKAFGDRIELIGVNYEESLTTAQLEKLGIDYPVAFDVNGDVSDACGVLGFPTNIITDRTGIIRYFQGSLPKDFEGYLEDLLKEEP